jgi:hypothetical protein
VIAQDITTKKFIAVFPLSQICAQWKGYVIDAAGTIYSNRQTKDPKTVKKMLGTRVYGSSQRNFTLNKVNHRGDRVLAQAKRASTWVRETDPKQLEVPELPAEAKPQWPFPTDKAQSDAYLGKKQDVLQAVKDRGHVIASITEGKLTFGAEPKIHSTLKSVDEEVARLAKLMPGTVFVKLLITGAVVAGGLTHL